MSDLRLCDLGEHDSLSVHCRRCGRIVVYSLRARERRGWLSRPKPIVQMRWRCEKCDAIAGFRVTIEDDRARQDRSLKIPDRVIVSGD
jgi:RNase P subunit RPR2